MNKFYLLFITLIILGGCSNPTKGEGQQNPILNNSGDQNKYEQESITKVDSNTAYLEEMNKLKDEIRTYIFEEYMPSSDYVYAKGINWSERFYDNLTAEEIWNVILEYKVINNSEEGTMFDKASYLSVHAPIKENWEELFLVDWKESYLAESALIEDLIDNGETVAVYTNLLPFTGEENNYPYITLFKRTGYWHG